MCLLALTLAFVLAPALPALKMHARFSVASPAPSPIECVPRADRLPFEYSPHREFTVLVLGAGCVFQCSESCTTSAGLRSCALAT